MLCQLICIDRRYQRMNCFSIRELQGILKRRFFTDLTNSSDHRELLNNSMIGLRFKTNNNLTVDTDISMFFNYGTTFNSKFKNLELTNIYLNTSTTLSTAFITRYVSIVYNFILNLFIYPLTPFTTSYDLSGNRPGISTFYFSIIDLIFNFVYVIQNFTLKSMLSLTYIFDSLRSSILLNLNLNTSFNLYTNINGYNQNNLTTTNYTTETITLNSVINNSLTTEISESIRFTRFHNPLISYDYKCGHYLGI